MQSSKNWSYRIFNNGDNSDYNAAMVTKTDKNNGICSFLKKLPDYLDTSELTKMQSFFQGCYELENIPKIDTSNVTTFQSCFAGCSKIKTIPQLNTSKATLMNMCFSGCSELESIPIIDTSNVTNFQSCFSECIKLKSIPQLNTSKGTSMSSMFSECKSIENIPQLDTSNVTSLSNLFYNCTNLKSIPTLNASKANNIYNIVSGCKNLTDFNGLIELGKAFTSKSNNYNNYTFNLRSCTNLTHESLVNIINNLYDLNLTYDTANGGTLYKQAFQLGKDNLAKLTADEILIATNKGWNVTE